MEEPSWLADSFDMSAYQKQHLQKQQQEEREDDDEGPDRERHSFSMMASAGRHHPSTEDGVPGHSPDPDHREVHSLCSPACS